SKEDCAHQEPWSVVGEPAEREVNVHDTKGPEQIATNETRNTRIKDFGCPREDHKQRDRKRMVRFGLETEGQEPKDQRHDCGRYRLHHTCGVERSRSGLLLDCDGHKGPYNMTAGNKKGTQPGLARLLHSL